MRAIIPVAGYGTRLRPHTYTVPKVLLNVAGKPIIAHILDALTSYGIAEATFVVGPMGEQIEQYVTDRYPSLHATFVEQQQQLGLGHAIWCARSTIGTEPIIIILGDTIFDADLERFLQSPSSTIGVKEVQDPRRFGVVELAQGKITRLIEKPSNPPSHLAIVGLYLVRNSQLLVECLDYIIREDIRTSGEFQLTDALQCMLDKGECLVPFPIEGWFDCGKPETLLETNRFLLARDQQSVKPPSSAIVIPPSYISPTAHIERSIVGPYATIGDGATVKDARVENSIIGAGAYVEAVVLSDSIIGNNATVFGSFHSLNVGDSSQINYA